jgi:hypothetical protein
MSMDQLSTLVIGTIFVLFIIGGLFLLTLYVRNHFFPPDTSDKLDGAMLEMRMLQARLESRAEEGMETPGDEGGSPAPEGTMK